MVRSGTSSKRLTTDPFCQMRVMSRMLDRIKTLFQVVEPVALSAPRGEEELGRFELQEYDKPGVDRE